MSSHRLAAGYGPETFSLAFPAFQSADLSRAYPDFYHESPHNLFLDALTQRGVPGLLLVTALVGLGLFYGLRRDARPRSQSLAAGLLACAVSLCFTPLVIPVAVCLYLSVAAIVAERLKPLPVQRSSGPASALTAVAMAFAGVSIWQADAYLKQACESLESGDIQTAAVRFDRARAWGIRADLPYSQRAASAAQNARHPVQKLLAWQQAILAAERATQSAEDRHNAFYNLAAFRAAENNTQATERNLRRAIEWAPAWFKPHWTLSRLLLREGKLDEARREAQLAVYLNASKDAEVVQTLAEIETLAGSQR
jgi:tetratricopeptide (TPR) repeat protein